jgi:uroporphyrinogen-III synthase
MKPLVILRPEPRASATAAAAVELGLQPIVMTLFAIEPIAWSAPDAAEFDGLLLTSANAVRHGGDQLEKLRGLPVYAVGNATAAAASDAGFTISFTGDGRIDDLLERIDPDLRLLHVGGEHRREPAAPRQSIVHVPVYRAAALPNVEGLERIAGAVVAVHSPRAAARVAELAAAAGIDVANTSIAAISPEAARAAGEGWERVQAAAEPTDTAILALASRLCQNR